MLIFFQSQNKRLLYSMVKRIKMLVLATGFVSNSFLESLLCLLVLQSFVVRNRTEQKLQTSPNPTTLTKLVTLHSLLLSVHFLLHFYFPFLQIQHPHYFPKQIKNGQVISLMPSSMNHRIYK